MYRVNLTILIRFLTVSLNSIKNTDLIIFINSRTDMTFLSLVVTLQIQILISVWVLIIFTFEYLYVR